MKLIPPVIFTLILVTSTSDAQQAVELDDEFSRLNYSVGYQIGSDFRQQEFEVRTEAIIKGIQDALSDNQALLSKQEMNQVMADMGQQVAQLKKKKREQIADYTQENIEFLHQNSGKPGIVTMPSGLQYRIVEKSQGPSPGATDQVMVHYRGRLIDGTEFDSSIKRGKPATFRVNQVIKGWTEALQMMQRGSHWQLFIPAELGYGSRGSGTRIPPNSTLIFDVELIAIR